MPDFPPAGRLPHELRRILDSGRPIQALLEESLLMESVLRQIATLPSAELVLGLRAVTKTPLEPQERQRLVRNLRNAAKRIDSLTDILDHPLDAGDNT